MKKNLSNLLPLLLCAVFVSHPTARAQETTPVDRSTITEASLPVGAQRVSAHSVPAGISGALKNLVAAGAGKFVQGESEVLAWAGDNYRKAEAANLMDQLRNGLHVGGWTYESGGTEGIITVFSVSRDVPRRRAVLGFFVPSDDALVVAWTELLPAGAAVPPVENTLRSEAVESSPVPASASSHALTGTWMGGGMSLLLERNTTTGSTAPRNGSTFKYVFTADDRFEFVGMMQSTMYGCTTTLFNDKRGAVEVDGSRLTLIPSKNFWRQQNTCAPNSTKERDYTLERETYEWRTKTDEYGKKYICLANAKGETCYRQEQK